MTQETSVNYNSLLWLFISDDHLRPALMTLHTIGDKTYATDTYSIIIIPTHLVGQEYPKHPKEPDFKYVLNQLIPCDEVVYKDVELFRALEKSPKEPDVMECDECNGIGECEHCGSKCEDCAGEGYVPDPSKPLVYTFNKSYIEIGDYLFSPHFMGRLEKVLLETSFETFSVIKKNSTGLMIKAGEIEMVFARKDNSNDKEPLPIIHLKPV